MQRYRKPGRSDPGGPGPARAGPAEGHRGHQEEERKQQRLAAHVRPRQAPTPAPRQRRTPPPAPSCDEEARRRRPIPCRLPSLCPLPPGLLRVRPERAVDLDAVAVARHRIAIAQRAENSDGAHPTAPRVPPPARAPAPAPRPPWPSAQRTGHCHWRSGIAIATVQRFIVASYFGSRGRALHEGVDQRRRRVLEQRLEQRAGSRDWRIRSAFRAPRGSRARRAASGSTGPRARGTDRSRAA